MDVPHIAWDACSLRGGLGFLLSVPQSSVVTLWLEEDRRCPGGRTGAVRRTRPPEGAVLAFGQIFPPNCRHYTGHLTSVISGPDRPHCHPSQERGHGHSESSGVLAKSGREVLSSHSSVLPSLHPASHLYRKSFYMVSPCWYHHPNHGATEPWGHGATSPSLAGYQSALGLDSQARGGWGCFGRKFQKSWGQETKPSQF